MNVAQLMDILSTCEPTDLVVMSRDQEGNGYLPLRVVDDNCRYDEDEGEIGLRFLDRSLIKQGYSEEDVMSDRGVNCVTFWP